MTVSTTTTRIEYDGDGSTAPFAVPFRFLEKSDLVVILRNVAAATDALQVLTTHYTVAGAGDASGGTVTFVTPPPVGQRVIVYNAAPITQALDLVSGDSLPAESLEQSIDKLTLLEQRTRDMASRSPQLADGDTDGSGAYDANSNRIANLGAPTANADAATKLYVATEINNAALSVPTGLIATGSTTSRTLADRWGQVANVKDFGAVGNGVADDGPAFSLAAQSVADGSTVRVDIPPGTYLLNTPISKGTRRVIWRPAEGVSLTGSQTLPDVIETLVDRQVTITDEPNSLWSLGDADHFTGDMSRSRGLRITLDENALPERLQTTTSAHYWYPPEIQMDEVVIKNGAATLNGSGTTTLSPKGAGYSNASSDNTKTITNVSSASAAVITCGTHSISVNDRVYVNGVIGTAGTVLNMKRLDVTAVSPTTITVNADTTTLAYTSGGRVYPANQRTSLGGPRITVTNYGEGDAAVYTGAATAGYENLLDSFLVSPSAVILAGSAVGEANGVVANGSTLQVSERNGADINGMGYGIDMTRVTDTSPKISGTNQPSNYSAKDCTWLAFNAKSLGDFCSAAYAARGKWHVGLDFTPATFADLKVAIALKQADRIYFTAAASINSNKSNIPFHATTNLAAADSIYCHSPTSTSWQVVIKDAAVLEVTEAGIQNPANVQDGDYTFVLSDAGKHVRHNSGSAHNYTVPPNSSVAFPVGTVLTVANINVGVVTLVEGSGVTLYLASSGASGNRPVANKGYARLLKYSTDLWLVDGGGVT